LPILSRFAPVLLLATLALAGCATTTSIAATAPTADSPVIVRNCGTAVTFTTAPRRVVTIKSTSTEMLLALGLGDRIVGTAFQDGRLPADLAQQAPALTSIGDQFPSEEVVLNTQPDMVFSGWESAFAPDAAGARTELAKLGIASYVSPSACRSADQPKKLSFDDVFGDISQVASIFRVDATPLLTAQKQQLAAITPAGKGRSAFWYSSGTDTPYAGAGIGAPELVLETVGLKNIAAGVNASWAPLSWEAVVAADPDFIVLIDASWNTVAKKIDLLQSNPATANLAAVKNGRYLVLPFASSEAGVRSVEAAASIQKQITKLDGN